VFPLIEAVLNKTLSVGMSDRFVGLKLAQRSPDLLLERRRHIIQPAQENNGPGSRRSNHLINCQGASVRAIRRRDAPEVCMKFVHIQTRGGERRMTVAPEASCGALHWKKAHVYEYPGINRRSRTQWF